MDWFFVARYSLAPVAKCVQEKLGKPVTFLKAGWMEDSPIDSWEIKHSLLLNMAIEMVDFTY